MITAAELAGAGATRARPVSTHRGSLATKLASIFLLSSLPSFITVILAIGIKESARFNSTIVVIKVSVVSS